MAQRSLSTQPAARNPAPAAGIPRPSGARVILLCFIALGGIVGAACQPLQPQDVEPRSAEPAIARRAPSTPATGIDPLTPGAAASAQSPATTDAVTRVALLLPLSGRQQALGAAVRDGFVAAHLGSSSRDSLRILVYDDARLGTVEAYRQAHAAGASVIVGPLLKESVQALAFTEGSIPVLALNHLGEGEMAPPRVWQFGLAPEDEAREIARRAIASGQRRAIGIAPESDWGRRVINAFNRELVALGGQMLAARFYATGTADHSVAIREMLLYEEAGPSVPNPDEVPPKPTGRRQDVDLVFMAATSAAGSQIAPQLDFYGAGNLPTYSTSAIWEDGSEAAADLDGIQFPDSPWVVAPDAQSAATKNALVRHWGRGSLGISRLYALGFDAFRLVPEIRNRAVPGPFPAGDIQGVTGLLQADADGRIHRRLAWAEIRNGAALPAPDPLEVLRLAPLSPGP